MYRDLHVMEPICYRGEQELDRSQVPQLEAVMRCQARKGDDEQTVSLVDSSVSCPRRKIRR